MLVALRSLQLESTEDDRIKVEEEFQKVMGSHQRDMVASIKDKAGVTFEDAPAPKAPPVQVPPQVPPLAAKGEGDGGATVSDEAMKDLFSGNPLHGQPSYVVVPPPVSTNLPKGLFKSEDERIDQDENNTYEMKEQRRWVPSDGQDPKTGRLLPSTLRTADEVLEEEKGIDDGIAAAKRTMLKKRREADEAAARMIMEIQAEQEKRRRQYEEEDRALLMALEQEKENARKARLNEDLQRR